MKLTALIIAIVVFLVSGIVGLFNAICGQEPFINGYGIYSCYAYFPSWSYDSAIGECKLFIYGGCGGNENRFSTKERCEKQCKG